MSPRCAECGAALPPSGSCREHFDTLLAREWQIPGGPGELPHFFAVASWGLQHPRTMNYTLETVTGLRSAVAHALSGHTSIEDLRRRARAGAREAGRITRRTGDADVDWHIAAWPVTVVDLLPAMTERDIYVQRVSKWARSVVETLNQSHPVAGNEPGPDGA